MPNWCENELRIRGCESDLALFEKLITESFEWRKTMVAEGGEAELSILEAFLGTPNGVDWYEWNIQHWGCKWSEVGMHLSSFPDVLYFSFDSAWAPPLAGIKAISEMWPSLVFDIRYCEPMMTFRGSYTYINGNVIACRHEENWAYDFEKEDRDEYWLPFMDGSG